MIAAIRPPPPASRACAPPAATATPTTSKRTTSCGARCYLAGLVKVDPEAGPPHRPAAVLFYPSSREPLAHPHLVIDVSATIGHKMHALAAYKSQFVRRRGGPATPLNAAGFLARVRARAEAAGLEVEAAFGEAFLLDRPLKARDPFFVLGGLALAAERDGRPPRAGAHPLRLGPHAGGGELDRATSGLRIGITCYPSAGGSGIVATELGKELARRGHDVHFITHAVPVRLREFEERIAFHPVEAESYPLFNHQPYALNLAAKMSEVIERENLEILHVHYALPHAVSAYLAKQIVRPRPVRVVTTLHGTDITLVGLQPSFFSVTKFSIEQSDAVTAVSGWLRDQTRSIFQVASPIEVIHNFVDLTRFAPGKDPRRRACFAALRTRSSSCMPRTSVRSRTPGGWSRCSPPPPSGCRPSSCSSARDPMSRPARSSRASSRSPTSVAFLGEQEYIEALLPIADVFLLPSAHESFGLVALEAMSSGVPVIATNVGGMPEVIEDGASGFLADPDDLAAMTEIAVALARDPVRRRTVGEAARERAAAFATGLAVERYIALYRSLLTRPESSPEPAPSPPSPPPSRTMKPTMRPKSPARAEK